MGAAEAIREQDETKISRQCNFITKSLATIAERRKLVVYHCGFAGGAVADTFGVGVETGKVAAVAAAVAATGAGVAIGVMHGKSGP